MSRQETLDRLAALQRGFSAMLRAPLDRRRGRLEADPAAYERALCDAIVACGGIGAAARLAVYNRQYWFRLFGVLQHEYRLTTALLGAWELNRLAADFLATHPPRDHVLARAADGFDRFLAAAADPGGIGAIARADLLEAVAIDQGFRTVSAATPVRLQLDPADASRLATARLRPSATVVLLDEHRPLLRMRHELGDRPIEAARPLPPPYPDGPRRWAIAAVPEGQRVAPLAPLQARLLRLLHAHPVGEALAVLEREAGTPAAALARDAEAWLAHSVTLGCWAGLEDAP